VSPAPLNAVDAFGFTPLLYAATVDFGDTATVKALLKSGADPAISGTQERTLAEQASHYCHTRLAEALKTQR
jgi:ankyrin repeat protein